MRVSLGLRVPPRKVWIRTHRSGLFSRDLGGFLLVVGKGGFMVYVGIDIEEVLPVVLFFFFCFCQRWRGCIVFCSSAAMLADRMALRTWCEV